MSLPACSNNQGSSQAAIAKLSKEEDQLAHSQNIGQHGQHGRYESTDDDEREGRSATEAQDDHVGQGLIVGQIGQLDGQVELDANDKETF